MSRLALISATLPASPALAHEANSLHLHDTDNVSLLLGFSLIGLGIGAATLMKVRKK